MSLSLASTSLSLLRSAGVSLSAVRSGQRQRLSQMDRDPVSIASKGALHLAFAKLFAAPFGAADVANYRRNYRRNHRATPMIWREAVWPRSSRDRVGRIAGWTGIGAAALGVSATLWAGKRQRDGKNASGASLAPINSDIRTLNRASYSLYGVAGVAAGTWLTTKLWPNKSSGVPAVTLAPTSDTVSWSQRW